MLRLRPTSLNRSHLALSHLTFTADGEVVDTRRRRLKSALWSSEMFHFSFFFSVGTLSRVWRGGVSSNLNAGAGKHLPGVREDSSLCHFRSRAASNPALLLAKWEGGCVRKILKKNNKKTTNINEVLHWGITMCALPDSICTSLMACAIMWASINIKAGSVTAKGFTSITAVPPLHVSISTQGKKYMWNTASVPGY